MELLLIRHAEPVRVEGIEGDGPADPGLTDRGHDQAERLAAWLAPEGIDAVVTSPLRRARETAAPLAARLELTPEVDDGLREYDASSTSYIPIEELRETRDHRWQATIHGRWEELGADPPDVFQARVVPRVEAIVDRHPGRRVAVLAHGGIVNVYLAHVLGKTDRLLWFLPAYTSISRVHAARGGVRSVASVNETGHLLAAGRTRVSWEDAP